MAEHMIETRIMLRYDTLNNWMSSTVILKQGEAAIAASTFDYTIEGTNHRPAHTPPAVGIKIGDGYHYFSELPWVQGVAGDVYSWAKAQSKPTYTANEIQGLTALIQQYINENANPGTGSGGEITVEARAYRLVQGTGNDSNKYFLESKGANDSDWVIDSLHYVDLSEFAAVVDWLGTAPEDFWNINGYVVSKVNERLALLNYTDTEDDTKIVTAVNQTSGKISVIRKGLSANAISGTVSVEKGGTGRNNLDYDNVLVGNGTSSVSLRPIETTLTSNNNLATNRAIIQYINNATAGLTGAMHFIGEASVVITNNSVVDPNITMGNGQRYSLANAQPGDVILYDHKEFVWTGVAWRLLGDEGSYAVKGAIVDVDIADDAAITQSKVANLVDDLASKVDKEFGKGLSANDYTTDDKFKLANIEENAQRNIIEHVYVNGTEVSPTTVDGKDKTLNLRVSALTPEEEEKISGIEAGAQANRIEHIFLNENELNIGVIKNISKSVNISINEFTNLEKAKLAEIENGAQVNAIETITINGTPFSPDLNKNLNITLDQSLFNLNAIQGARVPSGQTYEDVAIDNTTKKLELSRIAKTGDVKDIIQNNNEYVLLYCGTSIEVIDGLD